MSGKTEYIQGDDGIWRMKESEFKVGDKVAYIPYHAHGNIKHPDVEYGVVTSKKVWAPNEAVFVRFGNMQNSQGCRPDQLKKIGCADKKEENCFPCTNRQYCPWI